MTDPDQLKDNLQETKPKKKPLYLKIMDVLRPLYEKSGVDFSQARHIVSSKMLMDTRRDNPISEAMRGNGQKKKEGSNPFLSSLWVYVIFSVLLLFIFIYDDLVYQYTVYFSFLFVMLIATLITQFSTILLDTKDQVQINTKPVSSRTSTAAKATHIGIYLLSFAFAISGVLMVGSFVANGILVGFLTVFLTILAAIWSLVITILIYAFVLRRFDGDRLKNIIAYSQIALTIFIMLAYVFMSELFELVNPHTLELAVSIDWWNVFLFPLWFVAPFGIIQEGWTASFVVFTALLILGTIALIWLYRYNAEKIDQNLQKMDTGSSQESRTTFLASFFSKITSFHPVEKSFFHFTWQLIRKERDFKTRLYPSIVSALIFPFVFLWTFLQNAEGNMELITETNLLAYAPYFIIMMVPYTTIMMNFSSSYKARWVYTLMPTEDQSLIFRGMYKAVLFRLIFPLYFFTSILMVIAAQGLNFFVLANGFLIIAIALFFDMYRSLKNLPFTQQFDPEKTNLGCLATLILLALVMIASGIVLVVQLFIPYGNVITFALLFIIFVWILLDGFKHKKVDITA